MKKYNCIVCSGPTREWLDPVRYVTNASTGETGYYLAEYACQHPVIGRVIYISGPVAEKFQRVKNVKNICVECTADMAQAVNDYLSDDTLLFMVAAPADYKPVEIKTEKIKKNDKDMLNVQMERTIDVLGSISSVAFSGCFIVGFAAETSNLKEYALKKLKDKKMDLVCGNEVYRQEKGFGHGENILYVYDRRQREKKIGPLPKNMLAQSLFDYTVTHLQLI